MSDTENLPQDPTPWSQGISQKIQVLRWTEDQVQELCYKVTMADNKLHIKKC